MAWSDTLMDMMGLTMNEARKAVPINARMFAQSLTGDTSPLTEADMNTADLDALRSAVSRAKADGRSYFDYLDLDQADTPSRQRGIPFGEPVTDMISRSLSDPAYRMKTTIGQAGFTDGHEGVTVTDTYDFNGLNQITGRAVTQGDDYGFAGATQDLLGGNLSLYSYLRQLGAIYGPSAGDAWGEGANEKPGIPVRVNLGRVP